MRSWSTGARAAGLAARRVGPRPTSRQGPALQTSARSPGAVSVRPQAQGGEGGREWPRGPVPATCDSSKLQGPGIIWRPELEVGERSQRRASSGQRWAVCQGQREQGGRCPAGPDTHRPAPAWLSATWEGGTNLVRVWQPLVSLRQAVSPCSRLSSLASDVGFSGLSPGFLTGRLSGSREPGRGAVPGGLAGVRPPRGSGSPGSPLRQRQRGDPGTERRGPRSVPVSSLS